MLAIRNPSFAVESEDFAKIVAALRADPRPLPRPVLILAGYHAPSVPPRMTLSGLRPYVRLPGDRVLIVAYPWALSLQDAADKALRALREKGWSGKEVDVIGSSMGGIVARWLLQRDDGLRAARLFTLATPHRGALLAELVRPDPAGRDLRAGSEFLERLNDGLPNRPYELTCYATLRDRWVGARNTAPPGMQPLWLDARGLGRLFGAHFLINSDHRILAELALRLRGETPFAAPSAPPID